MSEEFENQNIEPTEASVSSADSGDMGADDDRGGRVDTGTYNQQNDTPIAEPPKPSGKSVKQLLTEEFAKAKMADRPLPQRGEKGRFQKASPEEAPEATPEPQTRQRGAHELGTAPPPGWSQEAKVTWEHLPHEVRQAIANREREVADGFSRRGAGDSEAKEVMQVFDPALREVMKNQNLTPGGLIKSLVQHANHFGNPDKQQQAQFWEAKATDWGVDMGQLLQRRMHRIAQQDGKPLQQVAHEVARYIYDLAGVRLQNGNGQQPQAPQMGIQDLVAQQVRQQVTQQTASVRDEYIARDLADINRRHPETYPKVRYRMGELINEGKVTMLAPNVPDLEEAHTLACKDLGVMTAAEKAEQDRQAATQTRQERVAAARKASVSIASGNPGTPTASVHSNRPKTVRDRLLQSVEELRS